MIMDKQSMFSDRQRLTASGDIPSDKVIDLGPSGTPVGGGTPLKQSLGWGSKVPFLAQIVETIEGVTQVTVTLQRCDDPAFGTGVVDIHTEAFPALAAGSRLSLAFYPYRTTGRYLRLLYTVDGTPTAGAVTCGTTAGNDETIPYTEA